MKDASEQRSHFGSIDRLSRFYLLGGSGAIDVLRPAATGGENDVTVLRNSESNPLFRSGFQEVLAGTFSERDYWCLGWQGTSPSDLKSVSWSRQWTIAPNNRNFPSATLPHGSVDNLDNGDDLDTFMTGIYANAVGCLCTYPGQVRKGVQVGQIATTIRIDNRKFSARCCPYLFVLCVWHSLVCRSRLQRHLQLFRPRQLHQH